MYENRGLLIGLASRVGNARRSNSRRASEETVGLSGAAGAVSAIGANQPAIIAAASSRRACRALLRSGAVAMRSIASITAGSSGRWRSRATACTTDTQARSGKRESNRKRKTAVAAGDAGSRCSTAAISLAAVSSSSLT
jgi:hypothetical protein